MRKLLILALALSPLFAIAQEYETMSADEAPQTQDAKPMYSNFCGSFSDTGCWGRFIGSYCVRYDGRYTRTGSCMPEGFRDARGEYSCRCF